jgi:uncharacterized protein (DUF2237 family)
VSIFTTQKVKSAGLTGIRVVLSATHEKALDVVDLEDLKKFAVEENKAE